MGCGLYCGKKGIEMKICSKLHQIKIEFNVTPKVERFVYVYMILGKYCYLIDSGVVGSEEIIIEFLKKQGRDVEDIKGIFLTHAHPDHIGSAATLKKMSGCKIYASQSERDWIEHIDQTVTDGDEIFLEEGLTIKVYETAGQSLESMSYYLVDKKALFVGDSIPLRRDIPIYIDKEKSIETLNRIKDIDGVEYYCPAWDQVYEEKEGIEAIDFAINYLEEIDECIKSVLRDYPDMTEEGKFEIISESLNMNEFTNNPLFKESIMSNLQ